MPPLTDVMSPRSDLSLVLDASGIGIWEYDHTTGRNRWSLALCQLLGYGREQAPTTFASWLGLIHPDDRTAVLAKVDAAHAVGDPLYDAEYRLRAADGHWVWFHSRGRVTARDADGRPARTAGTMVDVSERKQAEQLLRIQHAFATLLAEGPDRTRLLPAILSTALGLPDLDGGGLYWREADGSYRLLVHQGLSAGFVAQVSRLAPDSVQATIIRRGRRQCSCRLAREHCTDPALVQDPDLRAEGIVSLVVLPILVGGEPIACLNLASRQTATSPITLAALETLTHHFGQSLERLLAREEAEHQRHNLEGLFATLTDYLFVLDGEGRILHCNRAATAGLGYPEPLPGRMIWSLQAAALQEDARRIFDAMREGRASGHSLPLRRADGTDLMVDTRGLAGHWNGQPAVISISRDMTEARNTQEALHEREAIYRAVISQALDGIALIDSERLTFTEFNAAAHQALGYTHEEFARLTLADIQVDLAPDQVRQRIRELMTNGGGSFENRQRCKDGRIRWIRAFNRPLHIRNQVYLAAIWTDITEYKRITAELHAHRHHLEELIAARTSELEAAHRRVLVSDARLQALFEMSQDAASLDERQILQRGIDQAVELTGSRIGYLHLVNEDQQTIAFHVWSADTHQHCNASHETHYPLAQAGLWADGLRRRRPVVHNDYQQMVGRKGYPRGHAHVVRHLGVPVLEGDKVRLLLGVGNKPDDYTPSDEHELQLLGNDLWRIVMRQRAEAALAQAKESAERTSRAKSTFLANMSHEIRTPMNAIIGLTHLARRNTQDPQLLMQLRKIGESANHLLGVINDILDLSKIESGRVQLEETDFELEQILDRLTILNEEKATAKGLRILYDIDPALAGTLRGDPLRLGQILLNFTSNAVKFTDHGQITLRARLLAREGSALQVRFEVEDSGIGISTADQQHLFAAFEQADGSISRRYGGTGLGLAISRHLAQAMGGQVGLSSQPGAGSRFWCTVRLLAPAATADTGSDPAIEDEAPMSHLPGTRLLLAEDNPINQEVALALLEEMGFAVDLAADGARALAMARERDYALILMDVQMPVMDGVEATRAIRQLPAHRTTPILAMTANAFEEDRRQCLEAGMDDHLGKPVQPESLYRALRRWLPRAEPKTTPFSEVAASAGELDQGELREQLKAVSGLDLDAGLRPLRGQLNTYLRLLSTFVTNHARDAAELHGQLAADDREGARQQAHRLKGVAGTLGLTQLRSLASELESGLRDGAAEADLERLALALETELQWLVHALSATLPSEAAHSAVTLDWPRVRELIERIEVLLAEDDTQVNQLFRSSSALLIAALGQTAQEIQRLIDAFEYNGALNRLREAKAGRPELN